MWGATPNTWQSFFFLAISIHAPRVGSDPDNLPLRQRRQDFNPRSPCGERRVYFNNSKQKWDAISIHAPRVGSDDNGDYDDKNNDISIHAPRVGSDFSPSIYSGKINRFQSTLPVWGATPVTALQTFLIFYFNPRSPCGERREDGLPRLYALDISIHAPRVGSD